ncbi:predicted protein [Naegleria gruberi]|uniref:Predicted protein n=1 Tax=Naegleria gruberi TaxID=5762 RepID=D2VHW6_NAEGR|nr:uncharacterized protein NAEGRDRAFT_80024 [Naegleria gruberi]EFC43745.1 predicted protein [Naegleria gruberi]|eukprot:XP_002676489.1 predicted protein [Naegleria gruberi strain NEG-M]
MKKDMENALKETSNVPPPSPFNTTQIDTSFDPSSSSLPNNLNSVKLSIIHYLISKEKHCSDIVNTLNMLVSNFEEVSAPFIMDFKIITLIINILDIVSKMTSKDIELYCQQYVQDFDPSDKTSSLLITVDDQPLQKKHELTTRESIEVVCQQLVSFIHICLNNRELTETVKKSEDVLTLVRILTNFQCEEGFSFSQKLALDILSALLIKTDLVLVDSLHKKKIIYLLLDSFKNIKSTDYKMVSSVIETIVSILKQTISTSPYLYRDFNDSNGHQILQEALIECETQFETDMEVMKVALKNFSDLLCVGEKPTEPPQDYIQQMNFSSANTSLERRIKNIAIYQSLINIFLKTNKDILKQEIIEILLVVFADNSLNYPSVHHLHNMAILIRNLPDLSEKMQQSVLKLVEFIFAGLNFSPIEELKMLGELLTSREAAPKLVLNVLSLINKLLNFDSRFSIRFKEAYLFEKIVGMLCDEFESIIKLGQFKNNDEKNMVILKLLDLTIQVLISMLQKTNDNVRTFREVGGVSVLQTMLLNDMFRGYALKVFHTIIVQDTVQQSIDVNVLIEILQTSKRSNIGLKIAIFNALTKMFKSNDRAKESFRDAGFVASVSILINTPCPTGSVLSKQLNKLLEDSNSENDNTDTEELYEQMDVIRLMQSMFTALATSLQNHPRNKLSFLPKIGDNAIIDALNVNGIMNTEYKKEVFQCLIDFATEKCIEEFDQNNSSGNLSYNSISSGNISSLAVSPVTPIPLRSRDNDLYLNIGGLTVSKCPILHNPFGLLFCLKLINHASEDLQLSILKVTELMLKVGPLNLEGLSNIKVVDFILDNLYGQMVDTNHKFSATLLNICEKVACYRLSQLEWRRLLSIFADKDHPQCMMKLLMNAAKKGISTPFVEYRPGSECPIINLTDRTWNSSMTAGYTFSCWFYNTTDVSATAQKKRRTHSHQRTQSNASKRLSATTFGDLNVFILLNIQSDDGKSFLQFHVRPDGFLEFQNGPKSKRILFSKVQFESDKWHHLVVTHQRNRLSSSVMSIYVDGKLEESQKVGFVNPYAAGSKVTGILGKNSADSIDVWRMGPSFLYEDVLYPETVASIFVANNTYTGYFQGSYTPHMDLLTYHLYPNYIKLLQRVATSREISTETEAKESIVSISASKLSPERLVFAFNAHNHSLKSLDQDNRNNSLVLESLHGDRKSPKVLLPQLDKSFVCCPTSLSDNILNSDGIVVVLALIDRAETTQALYDSLMLLYNLMMDSPLQIDEVERILGYDIIASFIRKKTSLLDSKILQLLFDFVLMGSGEQKEIVTNLKAFICLIIDYDIWRKTDTAIQLELFQKIDNLVSQSYYTHWNVIRLKTTGIVTKLLHILSESPSIQIIEVISGILAHLFKHRMSDNDMISICNFLLSSLDDSALISGNRKIQKAGSWVMVNTKSNNSSFSLTQTPSLSDVSSSSSKKLRRQSATTLSLSNVAARNLLLKMLYDLASSDVNYLELFSKHVDEVWFYQFVGEKSHPISLILSLQLLCLLLLQGKIKPDNILPSLKRGLIPYCNQPDVYYTLLLLMTRTIFAYPSLNVVSEADLKNSLDQVSGMFNEKGMTDIIFCKEVIPILIELISHNYAPDSESALYGEVSAVSYFASFRSEEKSSQANRRWSLLRNVVSSVGSFKAGIEQEEASPVTTIDLNSIKLEERPRENAITKEILSVFKRIWRLSSDVKTQFRKPETLQALSIMLFSLELNKKPKVDTDAFLTNSIASSVLSILRAITTYELSNSSKGVQIVEDILKSPPTQASETSTLAFRSSFLMSLIKVYSSEKMVAWVQAKDSKLGANLSVFCSYVVDMHYASILPKTHYIDTLNFIIQVISTTKQLDVSSKFSVTNLFTTGVGMKKESSAYPFRSLNRMILYSFVQVSSSDFTEKVLNSMLDTQAFITSLDPNNLDFEYFNCIFFLLFTLMTDDSEVSIKDTAVKIWKLIVAAHHDTNLLPTIFLVPKEKITNETLQAAYDLGNSIVQGFRSLLDSDVSIFTKWFNENNEKVSNFFNNNLASTLTGYIEGENKHTHNALNMLEGDLMRNRSASRSERKLGENYGFLLGNAKSQLKHIIEMEEERTQVLVEESIIRLKFAGETWNNLYELLFMERGTWSHRAKEDNTLAWRLDSTEGPKRMRIKLEKFHLEKAYEVAIQSDPNREQNSVHASKKERNTTVKSTVNLIDMDSSPKQPEKPAIENLEKFQEWSYLSPAKPREMLQPKKELDDKDLEALAPPSITLDTTDISLEGSPRPLEINRSRGDLESLDESMESDNTHEGTTLENATADEVDDDDLLTMYEEEMGEDFKIRKLIEPGDMILFSYNSLRINGLDGQKSLFLICKNNAYIIDNYVLTDDDKLIEVKGDHSTLIESSAQQAVSENELSDISHETIKIPLTDINDILKRRYLLRETAVEIFCSDGRNFFLVLEKVDMNKVYEKLKSSDKHHKKAFPSLKTMQSKWQKGEVDNFEYLMYLNTLAGRSFNDLTQYPIFPWVLQDYSSEELNFNDPKIYRDLSKPMGAIDDGRAKLFRERYHSWCDPYIPKFHYGSHYSSAGIVLYYMLRIEPYTSQCVELQGGKFDIADRMFHSIKETWESASTDFSLSDVKELIPEFYVLPEFLINKNNVQFGLKQNGNPVNEVELPPWAHGNPEYFVKMMRKALESDYVSEHLHEWVDLIFGFKQKGPEAEKALNVFFYLTYEGSVDIDNISNEIEKRAIISQISNFGNTPQQLFTKPHPKRNTNQLIEKQPTISPTPENITAADQLPTVGTQTTGGEASDGNVGALVGSSGLISNLVLAVNTQPVVLPSFKKVLDPNVICVSFNKLKGIVADDVTYANDAGSTIVADLQGGIVAPSFTATLGKLTGKINKVLTYKESSTVSDTGVVVTTPFSGVNTFEPVTPQLWGPLAVGQISLTQKQLVNGIVAVNKNCFFADAKSSKYYSYGHPDYSLRLFRDSNSETPIVVHERLHTSQISHATITKDHQVLVCGGEDSVVSVFKIKKHKKTEILEIQKRLCGHTDKISYVTASSEFNIIVSGSYDATCIVWDLSRLKYVRELSIPSDVEDKPISFISVCPSTGQIIVCQWTRVTVYAMNGDILASKSLGRTPATTALKVINPYDGREHLLVGHSNGEISIFDMNYTVSSETNKNELTLTKSVTLKDLKSAVTCLYLTSDGKKLYCGGEDGVVYKYTCQL